MTREEAIEVINRENDPNDKKVWEVFPEYREALDMAIQALLQVPCDDAISRDAVINMLDEMIKDRQVYFGHHGDIEYSCGFSTFKFYVEQLPSVTQKSGKWIPVSERLPKDGTWNLFTDGKNVSVERYKYDALDHFYPSGRWFDLEDVVAWMPLPKPYKPQESEVQE